MGITTLLTACIAASGVLAYPDMQHQVRQLKYRQADGGDSKELLGDLLSIPYDSLTPVGKDLSNLLAGEGEPESKEYYTTTLPLRDSTACRQDTCCIWKYIADDMYQLFKGKSGRCTKWARFAVRLGFHDCGTWSKATASLGGGCDGSIILSGTEISRGENSGLQEIASKMTAWYDKYHNKLGFPVTMADLIQMGATVAAVTCPLGPRIKSYVGRPDSSTAAPGNLLPDVNAKADQLIELFQNKTIEPHGLVSLLGAHTTSQQHFVNTARGGDPQDSSPGVWDVLFYAQTLGKKNGGTKAPKRVFRFPSDVNVARHPLANQEWKEFAGSGGQEHWNEDYAREYIRLSLLGVPSPDSLTECSKVLPPAVKTFNPSDLKRVNKWLKTSDTGAVSKKIADELDDGAEVDVPEADIPETDPAPDLND